MKVTPVAHPWSGWMDELSLWHVIAHNTVCAFNLNVLDLSVLSSTGDQAVVKAKVSLSMGEVEFEALLRQTFPLMGEDPFEVCRVDRGRHVHLVNLMAVTPAQIKTCLEFNRSAVYFRRKVHTS